MKRIFLLIAMVSVWSVLTSHAQTTGNPATGFGGSFGGSATSSGTNTVSPPVTTPLPQQQLNTPMSSGTYSVPRTDTPAAQNMEAGPSSTVAGGSMGGAIPAQTYPSNGQSTLPGGQNTVPPTQPSLPGSPVQQGTGTDMNPGTGVGTGSTP